MGHRGKGSSEVGSVAARTSLRAVRTSRSSSPTAPIRSPSMRSWREPAFPHPSRGAVRAVRRTLHSSLRRTRHALHRSDRRNSVGASHGSTPTTSAPKERRVKLVFTAGYEGTAVRPRYVARRHRRCVSDIRSVADAWMSSPQATVPSGTGAGDMLSGGTVNTMREALREGPEEGADDPACAHRRAMPRRRRFANGARSSLRHGMTRNSADTSARYSPRRSSIRRSCCEAPRCSPKSGTPYGDEFAYREGTLVGSVGRPSRRGRDAVSRHPGHVGGARRRQLAAPGGPRSSRPCRAEIGEGPSEKALAETDYGLRARGLGPAGEEVFVSLRAKGHPGIARRRG